MQEPRTISVLFERAGDWWIAQCLQYDLATQARTVEELHYEIQRVIVAHMISCEDLGIEPFQIPPAPPAVWRRYEQAKLNIKPVVPPAHATARPLRHRMPETEARLAA